MSVRVNARLESEHSRKLAYLQARTGKSATEIVRASLELYFEHIAGPVGSQALLEGFVGSGQAAEDLSTEYKSHLTTSLEAKEASVPKRTRRK